MSDHTLATLDDYQPGIKWTAIAELKEGNASSLGYAGMVCGVHQEVLIMAGGANFPEAMPWDGGAKYYSDQIHILENRHSLCDWNVYNESLLPEPIAYAGSANTDLGVVYAGGISDQGLSSKTFLLTWNEKDQQVVCTRLADLPIAVSSPAMVSKGSVVYLIGGEGESDSSDRVFRMDLATEHAFWESLPRLPQPLSYGVAAIQNQMLYFFGGRCRNHGSVSTLHSAVFAYDLCDGYWEKVSDIFDGEKVTPFMASAAYPFKNDYIILAGGDKGNLFRQIEAFQLQIASAIDEGEKARLIAEKNKLLVHHPGFSTDVLMYNNRTNHWKKIGHLPFASQITGGATTWEGSFILSSGEVRPGVRSPQIVMGKPDSDLVSEHSRKKHETSIG